ncbi:MAG: hypothetical protein FWG11_04600, partial [Promicromonosporaceae bacterium]|nr:hypothetical protein [Promicromonosporaceae bacterium]
MPKQYPSRASLRSPAPLSPAPLLTRAERRASQQVNAEAAPAPCEGAATPLWAPVLAGQDDAADSSAAAPGLSSTRAARRDADSGPRRFASQNRMVHQGSIAAVTGAIILATFLNFSGGQEAAAEEGEDPRPITLAGGLPVVDRGALVSRAAERDGQDGAEAATLTAAPADAVPGQDEDSPLLTLDTAQTAAEYQLERAAHVLATEARTTPEQREDLLQTAAVMRELLEQIQMPDAPAPADPAIAETISEAIEATQVYAEAYIGRWLEPDHPIVQAAVLNMFTSDLESLMDDSVPVGIFVEAAPD